MASYLPIDDSFGSVSVISMVKFANQEARNGFIRKVYGLLTVQLTLTVLIALPFREMNKTMLLSSDWMVTAALVVTLATLCVMGRNPDLTRKFPTNYILLYLFTAGEGVMVGILTATYSDEVVLFAFLATALIFASMTAYAFKTETDFTDSGPYLFAAMSTVCIASVLILVMQSYGYEAAFEEKLVSVASLVLFTCYIVFDTQKIMGGEHHKFQFSIDDYVFAAIVLYLDIIDLFITLLEIFGDDRRR